MRWADSQDRPSRRFRNLLRLADGFFYGRGKPLDPAQVKFFSREGDVSKPLSR
jgi:hypothetical protein